jgi:hypothetical protein
VGPTALDGPAEHPRRTSRRAGRPGPAPADFLNVPARRSIVDMQGPPGGPPWGGPPYGNAPGGGYPQQPQQPQASPYGQQPPGYGQPQAPYGQPGAVPYGQPQAPYGQPPPGGYGAPQAQAPYGGFGPAPGAMPGMMPGAGGRAAPVRVSTGLYLALYIVGMLATVLLAVLASDPKTTEAAPFVPMPLLVLGISQMVLVFKMWSAINDGQTSPSPGKAVGFLFIPFFSLYWMFVVWPGYATRYNAYIQRHGIQVPPLGQGLIIGAMVANFVFPLAGLIMWAIVIAKMCKAVNALSAAPSR